MEISESKSQGWGVSTAILIAAILALLVVVFGLLWIATGSAQTAAIVALAFGLVVFLLLWGQHSYNLGSKQSGDIASNITRGMADAFVKALLTQVTPPPGESPRVFVAGGELPKKEPLRIETRKIFENGRARPLGLSAPSSVILVSRDDSGHTVECRADLVEKLINCPTPKRAEWTGDNNDYGQVLRFATAAQLVQRSNSGGASWPGTTLDDRLMWLDDKINAVTR